MRERTPSADDTPKRAPPAPPREAASADVAGSKTSNGTVELFLTAKLSSSTTPTTTTPTTSSSTSTQNRMVASTHNLDDLGVSLPASASNERQQQQQLQEKHGHTYKSAQTAQDKRSRLSNVINNLRKKVPDSRSTDSPRKEEDDRNSVERNLETLEKYVMTVLNGVIKDEEEDEREIGRTKDIDRLEKKESEKMREVEDSKFEPSKPNESRTEAAVLQEPEKTEVSGCEISRQEARESRLEKDNEDECKIEDDSNCPDGTNRINERIECSLSDVDSSGLKEDAGNAERGSIGSSNDEKLAEDNQEPRETSEEKKEGRTLGTIIMERLSDHQNDDRVETVKEDIRKFTENMELRSICRDLLNDLLNDINQLIDENGQEAGEKTENSDENPRVSQEFSMTSLHCSLPLDKVASVLQNCQTTETISSQSVPSSSNHGSMKSPSKPSVPTVRHLCLYCDRKFLSISLRQRHTERVHQLRGGRRSERNSRKPSQNCQYCSDKCAESLEGLFQHMVGSHGDKYHACVQCSTRYLTREALVGHMNENHSVNVERMAQVQEKLKEPPPPCKDLGNQSPRERSEPQSPKDRRIEEPDSEHRTEPILLKPIVSKDNFSNPGSPEFDSSFYSSVSCNIRENLLHHLDGKLQTTSSPPTSTTSPAIESKQPLQPSQQQQSFYEHNQIQFPIDISLTAATPVYTKDYGAEEYENSSEYAQKPGKSSRSHPRRVSFEKYNFPRKYDGKEQWTCSIKDLSKFDISTQLSLRKKQQLLKERITLNRLHQIPILEPAEATDIVQSDINCEESLVSQDQNDSEIVEKAAAVRNNVETVAEQTLRCEVVKSSLEIPESSRKNVKITEFSLEFENFLRLRKWDENCSIETRKSQNVVYAELTGEWSRPRIYICGACASKHVTLRELEDHKISTHPNVWCSHFEFSGDQRELYKHLFLPGRSVPTAKARTAILPEKVCTKCSKNCNTLPELHRHMLECGGDQAWLLGLFGNGKKKCKWRPFGSRSRRRRQRGMKRNIQNSQTQTRVNVPKEKQPTGPRVRPSDRESIQKMLANLPAKRATRKVLQDSTLRAQGRLRNVQTRSRPRMVGDNSSASRLSRNKAALRNKLLKNAKSIQRNRCRIDNITAIIESVVSNYSIEEKKSEEEKIETDRSIDKDAKEKTEVNGAQRTDHDDKITRQKVTRGPRILGKKKNIRTKERLKTMDRRRERGSLKKIKMMKNNLGKEETNETKNQKKTIVRAEKEADVKSTSSPVEVKSPTMKNRSPTQTTPKRKRPVDPVASLNASLKAKSQLRTQDGKFARNPNKDPSPQKSPESLKVNRQVTRVRSDNNSESGVTRKMRAVSKIRNNDQSKRTTRLSSDSDKMPTLEPAFQVNEEYVETSVNDLPILSPVAPTSSEKGLRGKNSTVKNSEEKENSRKSSSSEVEAEKSGEMNVDEEKDVKVGKGRRSKEVKNVEKDFESVNGKTDGKDSSKKEGRVKNRKNVITKNLNVDESPRTEKKNSAVKNLQEVFMKKETKLKKEENATKTTLETRSNSRAKFERTGNSVDDTIKIQNMPFEVKKLIGSNNKEDLLTTLSLTSRDVSSKRTLRQSVPRSKPIKIKNKVQKDVDLDKVTELDSEVVDVTKITKKEKKFGIRRKSPRNPEKKTEKDVGAKDEKLEEVKIPEIANEVKTTIRGRRRSNSLSSEMKTNPVLSPEGVKEGEKSNFESGEQESDNKRQTRGSLVYANEAESQIKEASNELNDTSLKKNTSFGRKRGRIKGNEEKKNTIDPVDDRSEEINKNNQENDKKNINESLEKLLTLEENPSIEKQEEIDISAKISKFNEINDTSEFANPSLSNLQLETNNSMDSGKENSLETTITVQKLKVGRPKKSWGSRRERTSKRSLSNVIGILTEGMNIPVEAQQSVVLTVQTTLDNQEAGLQNNLSNPRQSDENNSDRTSSLEKTEKPSENDVLEGSSNTDREEARTGDLPEKLKEEEKQLETSEVSEDLNAKDSLSKDEKTETKEQSPANDIILDLSRRKQKGKGSFLEKIVSKIAKQKDALLEGEVGSLLDTAADELTSILDEVSPTFSEPVDGTAEMKNTSGKSKSEDKDKINEVQADRSSSEVDSACQDVSSTSENQCEPETVSVEKEENSTEENRIEEMNNETERLQNSSDTSKEEMDTSAEIESMLVDENNEKSSVCQEEIQNEVQTEEMKNSDEVLSLEADLTPDEIRLPVTNIIPETVESNLCLLEDKCEEESTKKDEEMVEEDPKPKRKSKKRSLETNSPKKNKRKSVEVMEEAEENLVTDEIHLADIMKLIDTSRDLDVEKSNEEEKIQPGKRKTISDLDSSTDENRLENNVECKMEESQDSSDGVKKLKTDGEEIECEESKSNDDVKSLGMKENSDQIMNEVEVNEETKIEDNRPLTLRITNKRKSYVDNGEQNSEVCPQVRRSSKRRSLSTKLNQSFKEEIGQFETKDASNEENSSSNLKTSFSELQTEGNSSRNTKTNVTDVQNEETKEKDENFSINSIELDSSLDENSILKKSEENAPCQTILRIPEVQKIFERDCNIVNQDHQDTEMTEDLKPTDSSEPEKLETIIVPKVPKKRGRKKKSLANEHLQLNDDPSSLQIESTETSPDKIPGKKSTRSNRPTESEENKNNPNTIDPQVTSSSLEHFKIPEVTEVLQQKKRTSKRKSMNDEHLEHPPLNTTSIESEVINAEDVELNKNLQEKNHDEEIESSIQKDSSLDDQKNSSKKSNEQDNKMERSNSSCSIDLVQSSRTRSSKRKQISSEDLSGRTTLDNRAESVDNLSEASCASESSYFRKKRFTRKKKDLQENPAETDTSATDSESIDTEKSTDRRQSLKRRAKNNISFIDDPFMLLEGFDTPVDMQDCLQNEESFENEEQKTKSCEKLEDKSKLISTNEDEKIEKNETESTLQDEQEGTIETENNQTEEEFQTPKKRAAGNFVVVHKKTGEILIVEKRKKLTKEAARFFCDVCATSFTRKSSLKKHNLSQSHLLQLSKSNKDKESMEYETSGLESTEEGWKSDTSNDCSKNEGKIRQEFEETRNEHHLQDESLQSTENESHSAYSCVESGTLARTTREDVLEDELLDEEICKITENMSHDEYVITDHVNSLPESSSTPIKVEVKKSEEVKKKKTERKKERTKKKNLAEEHLALDTPEPEPIDSTISESNLQEISTTNLNLQNSNVPEVLQDSFEDVAAAISSVDESQIISEMKEDLKKCSEEIVQEKFESDDGVSVNDENEMVTEEDTNTVGEEHSDNKVSYTFKRNSDAEFADLSKNETENFLENQARVSLKFTISKCNVDAKESNVKGGNSYEYKKSDVHYDLKNKLVTNTTSFSANDSDMDIEAAEENEVTVVEDNRSLLNSVHVNPQEYADSSVSEVNYSEIPISMDSHDFKKNNHEEEETEVDNLHIDNSSILENNELEKTISEIIEFNDESKTQQYVKTKKNKGKKHNEDLIDSSLEDRTVRKSTKSKRNQNKQDLDDFAGYSESIDLDNSDYTSMYKLNEKEDIVEKSTENLMSGSSNILEINNLMSSTNEDTFKSDELEIEEKSLHSEVQSKTSDVILSEIVAAVEDIDEETKKIEINIENTPETNSESKIEHFTVAEDDEVSSSSSLADKPLLQLLSNVENPSRTAELEITPSNLLNALEKCKQNEEMNSKVVEFEDNSLKTKLINDPKNLEEESMKKIEEDETETTIPESVNNEEILKQNVSENSECDKLKEEIIRKPNSDRQTCRKNSKSHKSSSKDNRRRSKGPKNKPKKTARTKINDLTSESEDSENESKMEPQNKNKIVKCVFGRVFGEKPDKVKEVLNDWVSKSEDDSDISRAGFQGVQNDPNSSHRSRETLENRNDDKSKKKHSISSSGGKKRSGRKPKKSSSSDRLREKNSVTENQDDDHRSSKQTKSRSNSSKKHETEGNEEHFSSSCLNELVLPISRCRESKKIAEERISKAFEDETLPPWKNMKKCSKSKEPNYVLRNQPKIDVIIKDSGYGSFNYDEGQLKDTDDRIDREEDEESGKRRKSNTKKNKRYDWKDLIEKKSEDFNEIDSLVKPIPQDDLNNRINVDIESSHSCSSLAPSSVRNRSPSIDRRSQTNSDDEEQEDDIGHGRISPLFICGTPRSSIESSSNSENEEEDGIVEEASRKRSSSEFSGEKIVIRSPSASKTEVVTIAPTDAIEDNALDVPQEIETTKPRQGKVLNFDEELFVECCSRLKATTENELRGAKKIKLDHIEGYHRKEEQQQGFRGTRDRWRDVESQNSLGSLLESVNQLLGEEMYSTRERDYPKRGGRNHRSEHSSRSASPDMSRADNLGYEDSLDVAFEHNNKLRDKIQQRMRESENLIASTFGQKTGNEILHDEQCPKDEEDVRNSYPRLHEQGTLVSSNLSNGGYGDGLHVRNPQDQQIEKVHLDTGFKSKMNSALGGLLDKALSNLLHSNGKHDQNGSTPMKVLAELACARAPTSTSAGDSASQEGLHPKPSALKDTIQLPTPPTLPKNIQKKAKNSIKELFERKREMNERKHQEKSKSEGALRELNIHRQRKTKKMKKRQDFPLIRRNEHGVGMQEKKKRRDGLERKEEHVQDRIKDVYEFDEEESQMEQGLGTVMSYRSRVEKGYEVSCLRTKELDVAGLMSKAIGDSLENGKNSDALGTRLESMIDRKFKELEKFAPKTKGALKAFQSEEQRHQVTGPMDDFVERKQQRTKRLVEQNLKHSKMKKRGKNPRKKGRNAWYENDSSDEYRTAVKAEDIGVGISKSQRTCSKGKQNLFAEMSSSGSEYDNNEDMEYEPKKQRKGKKGTKKIDIEDIDQNQESDQFCLDNEDRLDEWRDAELKNDDNKQHDCDNKKSESEMSDHPLVIDERKDSDEQRNSDEETETQYERNFELDDLYREDSSVAESETEETIIEVKNSTIEPEAKSPSLQQEKIEEKTDFMPDDELIPLEEALDLLDQPDANLSKYEKLSKDTKEAESITIIEEPTVNATFIQIEESPEKSPSPVEEPEEEQDDDVPVLPEKLSSNEKPQKESENLPLHVFLSRKVQESKKRKEQQLKKMQEEQERILLDLQPTRRQRKCAIGKQGLLAEISSSDEETCLKDSKRTSEKSDHEKPRKQKRESKEKRKERYIEKKHEQMIAKEQKAIEEEILRELGKKKEALTQSTDVKSTSTDSKEQEHPEQTENNIQTQKKKHQSKEKQRKSSKVEDIKSNNESLSDLEENCKKEERLSTDNNHEENNLECSSGKKKHSKSPTKPKKVSKVDNKLVGGKKSKNSNAERSKSRAESKGSKEKERRSSSGRRDSDDEELKTTKSWNKVEEGVGVAIGRRKRAAANQLYYWSSSSDEEEMLEVVPTVEEEEDDRQEQHGWIVGDSHKRMITMLAMEKQLKEKRRRSEDEFEPGKAKSKKHRNSTS